MFVPCFVMHLGFCVCSMFCYVFGILCLFQVRCVLLCVRSSFAIIMFGKRELVSYFVCLPCDCC